MKKILFNDMDATMQLNCIYSNKALKDSFDAYIQEVEIDYMNEILKPVISELSGYCLDAWEPSYIKVSEAKEYDFICGLESIYNEYGIREDLLKLVQHTKNLYNTNLFSNYAKQCAKKFFADELKPRLDWIEEMSLSVYNNEINSNLRSYLEMFIENGYLNSYEEIYFNEDTKTFHFLTREIYAA